MDRAPEFVKDLAALPAIQRPVRKTLTPTRFHRKEGYTGDGEGNSATEYTRTEPRADLADAGGDETSSPLRASVRMEATNVNLDVPHYSLAHSFQFKLHLRKH